MIRDRAEPVQLFELVPQLQLRFEPELAELDRLLEDDELFQQVRGDLARRRPQSLRTGRPSTPVEVILRLLVVKHLYGWSYEETEHFVNDSLVLRQFCRLGLAPAPDDTTLLRWANLIQPATMHRLLDRVTELARQRRVTRGRKLRTDSTVVETAVHYPSDSGLLSDGVRVLSRLVKRARPLLPELGEAATAARELFRDRTRSARRLAQRISKTTVRASQAQDRARQHLYQRLLEVAQASLRQAHRVRERLTAVGGATAARAERPRSQLDHYRDLVGRVVSQTERRVLHGETVPAAEKVTSLFEPHTAVIARGKARRPTEFGLKVVLDEVEGGLVTRYAVAPGNPPDAVSWAASLDHHLACFGRPPDTATGDRGFFTPDNERQARRLGVRWVALPQPGGRSAARQQQERQPGFRRA